MADQPAPLTLAQNFVNAVLAPSNYAGHDAAILRAFNIISASLTPTPQITTRLTVTPSLCNGMAILHGGATALIFDECTTCTLALVRKEGSWQTTGVSRTLNIVYLDAVKEGEEIEVVAEIVKIGGRLGKKFLSPYLIWLTFNG